MSDWGFDYQGGILGEWPKTAAGDTVPPALLEHLSGNAMEVELQRSFLLSCGIATVCRYPNDGELGNVLFGYAGGGVDLFVPETLLEDARALISGEAEELPEDGIENA